LASNARLACPHLKSYEMAGTPIGGNDLLIAAQAMALDHTLVTDNDKEFTRIDGLRKQPVHIQGISRTVPSIAKHCIDLRS
jgi:predicted nucleic acid-binding protein